MDSNTGVLVLNDLEDLEYAERRRDPSARRRHIVDITDAGLEALESAEVAQGSIEEEILGGLSVAERGELRRLLLKALEEHEEHDSGEAEKVPSLLSAVAFLRTPGWFGGGSGRCRVRVGRDDRRHRLTTEARYFCELA